MIDRIREYVRVRAEAFRKGFAEGVEQERRAHAARQR